jgi:putative colanic acid biosynthesis UDP-glucose lipid carrier transferase
MHDLIERNASRFDYLHRIVDVVVIFIAGQIAALIRFSATISEIPEVHSIVLYFCCALAFALFSQFALYASWRGRSLFQMFNQIALAIIILISCGLILSFLIRQIDELSRLWVAYWAILTCTGMMLSRALLYLVLSGLRELGINNKRVMIVGYGDTGRELHKRALTQKWTGYQVSAIHSKQEIADDIAHIEKLHDIPNAIKRHNIQEIWLTVPIAESGKLQIMQYLLRNLLVDVRWVPDIGTMAILSNKTIDFMGMPAIELNRPASAGVHGLLKELFDKIFALIALILLLPLFIVLAIAIKLSSPGPVFFRQPRLGLNGKRFDVYKFRSMKPHKEFNGKITQATRDDPRITPIGRFIRRTSLDELPQFINVLIGDMSVVGPRPHAIQHNNLYKNKVAMYMQRHRVKPGITGWAQINGCRGETDTDEKMQRRVAYDLQYIKNWSFWMDVKIISWTAFKGWTDTNAY